MLKYVENHFECSGVFKRILVGFLNNFGGVGGSCTQLEAVGKAEWLPWGSEVSLLLFHKCLGGLKPHTCVFLELGGSEAGNLYCPVLLVERERRRTLASSYKSEKLLKRPRGQNKPCCNG